MTYEFPPARGNGPIREVLPDLFFVTGGMRFPGPVPVRISRNMTIVRRGGSLALVNTVRLDDAGLAALDALGKVEHVVRIAGFHGSDDPFYKDRYGATVWAVERQPYARGFSLAPKPEDVYFRPDHELNAASALPVPGKLHVFGSCAVGEALLLLDVHGGVVVAGDVLQNWVAADEHFNLLGRVASRAMGFLKPCNVGPGWLRQTKPDPAELLAVLDLPFEHVLPSHGLPVIGGARAQYEPALRAAAAWSARARG